MAVTIKSKREIELMTQAGKYLAEVLERLEEQICVGMTTWEVDQIAEEMIRSYGCIPSFLNFEGFPASICTSLNDEVVHGIPSRDRVIQDGDLMSLDVGLIYHGYHSDSARSFVVGSPSAEAKLLIDVTRQSFFEGLRFARAGYHLNEIGIAVQAYAESFGYGVVRDLVGHGLGQNMHEDPEIPNFKTPRRGIRLRPGMTLAVEPMINAGTWEVAWDEDDDWTVYTADGSLSAHYENTILITDGDPVILTMA